jgi:hypothetical protein
MAAAPFRFLTPFKIPAKRGRARDEKSPGRAERAGFLFRGERSPSGSENPRWGIERVTNLLPFPSVALPKLGIYRNDLPKKIIGGFLNYLQKTIR